MSIENPPDLGCHNTGLMVVNTDISLRHTLAADKLGIPLTDESYEWQVERQQMLVDILETTYGNVADMPAAETRIRLGALVAQFREDALSEGVNPVVVSLDPVFLDPSYADYTFQETRASLIGTGNPLIDIEHNPRSHVNRFIHLADEENGAGKALDDQLRELQSLISARKPPIALALVEDFVNTGNGILGRFAHFIENPDIHTSLIAGLVSSRAFERLTGRMEIISAIETGQNEHIRHMDMNDMLPTLGGRAIGWREDGGAATPQTVGDGEQRAIIAVDAICGDYPWQADIYSADMNPAFMQKLGEFCVDTALGFWATLEKTARQELTWRDLRALTGYLRVYHPAQDLTPYDLAAARFQLSPRRAIQEIAGI